MSHPPGEVKGSERNTVRKRSKYSLHREARIKQLRLFLRERLPGQGRVVYRQMLRGAAYSVGSGSVSLLILWFESRH